MKIEMQSNSSDMGEADDAQFYRKTDSSYIKKKLWNSIHGNSVSRNSVSVGSTQRKESNLSDEDFEFVITKNTNAKKVKRSGVEGHDNYKRFEDRKDTRHRINGDVGRSFDPHHHGTGDTHRHKQNHKKPVGHPGLERTIDFDPFESSSDDSSQMSELYDVNRYTPRTEETPFEPYDFPPTPDHKSGGCFNPNRGKRRKSYVKFFSKIKTFFICVGSGIRKCYTKSKNYFSRVIRNSKAKRRNRKCRQPLVDNQQCIAGMEPDNYSQTPTPKSGTVYRQKLQEPFDLNSLSSLEETVSSRLKKKKPKFNGFKIKDLRKSKFANSKKNLKPVKLNSFPD